MSEQIMLASGERLTRSGDVELATKVGPKVHTVLGLSVTSTSFGWVLLDGQGPDAATLDHDAFDTQPSDDGTSSTASQFASAVRGAQTIATASGQKVGSVHLTWTEDVKDDAAGLLKSLADMGFDNVHAIPLNKAAQAWGIDIGRQHEYTKTGLCILEPDTAMVMVVATGAGTVRTAIADNRGVAEDLVEWLRTVFRRDGWLPAGLYIVGAHADLDQVTQSITDALPIPVCDSVETQLALARGAALTTVSEATTDSGQETPAERPWRVPIAEKPAPPAAADTAQAGSVSQDNAATGAIDTPPGDGRRNDRPWLVSHAKKVTIAAAAVAVLGAALSLAAGSALNVENASTQAADPAGAGSSVTSVSIHTVPSPISAQQLPPAQPLAVQPPPPLPPPTDAMPASAEPLSAAATSEPEPAAIPVPHQTVSALPSVTPTAAAPLAAATAQSPAAPIAVPPAAPAPMAPPPVAVPAPTEPADAPPPDPVQVVLSPLFSGLP